MKIPHVLILTISVLLLSGCGKKENEYSVLMAGTKSEPTFDKVALGTELIDSGHSLAVFGHGRHAGDIWGELTCTDTTGESYSFRKGGVIVWSPPGEDFIEISGVAEVELVAYILTAKANEILKPHSLVLENKIRIPKGAFEYRIE